MSRHFARFAALAILADFVRRIVLVAMGVRFGGGE
jgi:hypothetical protein